MSRSIKTRAHLALAVVLLAGALMRALYLVEIASHPEFSHPTVDASYHDYWANGIATGDWRVPEDETDPQIRRRPFFRPPGYAYWLALVYRLFGRGQYAPRLLQMAAGLLAALLAYLFARRPFGAAVGLVYAGLMALYWIFIYYEGELLGTSLEAFLSLLLLWLIARGREEPGLKRGFAAGLALGVAALFRPNVLLFWPVAAAWLGRSSVPAPERDHSARRRLGLAGFLLGTALAVFPAAVRNYLVGGEFVPIAANAGMSLAVGNNPLADGTNHNLPYHGIFGSPFDYPRAVRSLEGGLGLPAGTVGWAQASSLYGREAVHFIRDRPLDFLRLTAKKAVLFWGPREVANIKELDFVRLSSPVLRSIPLNFPAVLALALLGAAFFILDGRRRESGGAETRSLGILVLAFVGLYFLSMLPFVAAARYRVPAIPGILLFSALGICRVSGLARDRRWVRALGWAAAGLALFFLCSRDPTGYRASASKWHYDLALALANEGKTEEAIQEYRAALGEDPEDFQSHNNLGALYVSLGRYTDAIREYEEALRLEPGKAEILSNLGIAWFQIGKTDEAMKLFARALAINPECVQAYNNRASALERLGRGEEAIADYRRVAAIKPGSDEAHYNLGLALGGKGAYGEAIDEYREAIRLHPGSAYARNNLGNALAALGRNEEAAKEFERALTINPLLADAHNNLANLLARKGDWNGAIGHYEQALQIDPAYAEAHLNLGATLSLAGDTEGARVRYEKAIEIDPRSARAHYGLALLLIEQGRSGEARRHLETALSLNPDFPAARSALERLSGRTK
jgi:tetratricopeptide (TPR) repeat protein